MGQEPSQPRAGSSIQVIGAGLPRTGTTSLALALSILLAGPLYDRGAQIWHGRPSDYSDLIKMLHKTPMKSASDRRFILRTLRHILDGCIATTDTPGAQFVPELLEIWPDTKVICTIRDRKEWATSINQIGRASGSRSWMLSLVLLLLPGLRYFTTYVSALQHGRWGELYFRPGDANGYSAAIYERHIELLKSVIPEEKHVFYDVRDGREPLCGASAVRLPDDIPFPKLNDSKSADQIARAVVMKILKAWAKFFGGGAFTVVSLCIGWRAWK
ncbi:hypothetical protein HBI56_014510 [Parastagonospora nodorum]|uniref:NAD dependent epimerase/dehydratase n=2 Tax=Phaeosphaeria nodorum (strain SN15 / ATCC MYA-4574 / FGSC 10173) TaxID=321614 RepID=A0A7U2F1A0_PHANO|nr:hypothetical protein HBH56_085470 [Parastagonospora nodorum]QRC96894.1 hypothetical protein JI435_017810 [Parastagonospora nodorum SN15]KAH3930034.1 hypothetical protein HBH54_116360 [Parastagonospora nodorum]KAH3982560.1 hypothetical protein HBH52_081180 [Parastagonospora nodorum]KAH4007278.1 hypothetical protein HBI10_001160 [Parastagonospora nodorum]